VKRAVDVIFAVIGLVVTAPVMAVVALLVRRRLGSPVLFRQMRPGMHGEPFELVKFRTMHAMEDERRQPLPDEVRLTPFGASLRSTSLDELPELWCVVRGDMSLVGPRPLLMEYLPRYTSRQARRHEVKPGLTGWAQVNGRNAPGWEERLEMDVWYVENRSLLLDLRILLMTVRSVLGREGISAGGHATVERFGE
jgi:lipopolysaccharide/colanic/teichoic acid biosynthesis glycosyltransferase